MNENLRCGKVDLQTLENIFDGLPDCLFFVKDSGLKYVAVNSAMMRLCGVRTRNEIIGKRAINFFPPLSSVRYEVMDQKVLKTGQSITDKLELVYASKDHWVWLFFSRTPVLNKNNKPVGIIGTARQFNPSPREGRIFNRLKRVILHIQTNFDKPLNLPALSKIGGVSGAQIERDFSKFLNLTPRQYLHQTRFSHALKLLEKDISIAQIAHKSGYADQSAFTRRFKAIMGMPPRSYRKKLTETL